MRAYGNNNVCTVSSCAQSGADEVVNVRCFTSAGAPADSRFIAHVTNRTDGAARGYLWSNDATPPIGGYVPSSQYSFDSTGQGIAIHGEGTGADAVELSAFGQDAPETWTAGSLRVTAYGTAAVTCQVFDPDLFTDPDVLRCAATTRPAARSTAGSPSPTVAGWCRCRPRRTTTRSCPCWRGRPGQRRR